MLRATTFHYPPFVFRNPGASWSGVEVSILDIIAQSLGLSVTYQPPTDGKLWGFVFPNRSAVGLKADLLFGRSDIGFASYFMFDNKDFDYTYPHGREGYCFATRNPTESSEWDVIFKPFTLGSWMLLAGTLMVSLGFLLVLARLFPFSVAKPSDVLLMIYGSCIAQSRKLNPSSIGAKIFLADFMVISNFLSIIYSGALFSSLAVNSKVPVMNTLMEMVQYKIEVGGIGTGTIEWFVSAENEAYRQLAGRYSPFSTLGDAMEAARGKPMNVVNSRTALEYHLRSHFTNKFGEPEFRIMDECWIHYPISYLLPKNSSYTDSINRKLFQLRESGLVDDLITREMDKMSKMFQVRNLVASQKRLTLADLYEPFLILVIGLSLAFIAFLFECTSHKLGTRSQLRQN